MAVLRQILPLILCLSFASSAQESELSVKEHETIEGRLEVARQYLITAVIGAPPKLDLDHVSDLRELLRSWIQREKMRDESDTANTASAANNSPKDEETLRLLSHLYPSKLGRFARLLQFKADAIEQPKTIVVQTPGTKTTTPTLNPDHVLWKYSTVFLFSELYPLTADLQTIYEGFKASDLKLNDTLIRSLNGKPIGPCVRYVPPPIPRQESLVDVDCLRRVRKRDVFWRAVSGFTATASIGQNPRFVQNSIIPDVAFEGGLEHSYSGEVDFDPKNLFTSGSDWKAVKQAVDAIDAATPDMQKLATTDLYHALLGLCPTEDHVNDKDGANVKAPDCLDALAKPRRAIAWGFVAAVVPTFTFKVQSQFDFIKNVGGAFVSPPFPENHLWQMSFTTDLRKAVASIKSRSDAANLFAFGNLIRPHRGLLIWPHLRHKNPVPLACR